MVKPFADGDSSAYHPDNVATAKQIHRQLDPAILAQMEEPITVSVSRVMGGARSPLTLPPREADGMQYPPGQGWGKDHIAMLEGWLVSDFSGGGLYNIKIVDNKGLAFEWQPFFDPQTYPPRVPYTMAASATMKMAQPQPQSQPGVTERPDWPPQSPMYGTPIATSFPSQVPMTFPPFPYGFQTARTPSADEDRRRFEDEKRAMSERLSQLERERLEEKHRADLALVRAENDRKFDEMKQSLAPKTDEGVMRRMDQLETALTKIVDRLTAPQPHTGPTPEMLALQEANRRLESRLEEEARERRHTDAMNEMKRQIETMANRPTGPDPMLTMILDAMKDGQRNSQSIMDGMQRQMLTPQDVLNLAKSTSSGLDDLKTNFVRMFSDVFDLQKRAFETAAQMLPQGESPAVRIIEQGIEKAGQAFESWQASKDAGNVANAKAVAAQANAQRAAIDAQRSQLEEMARREEHLKNAQRNAAYVPQPREGLGGATMPQSAPVNGAAPAANDGGRVIPFAKPAVEEKRFGRTDIEWFGGAVAHVERLRAGVTEFLVGISTETPTVDGEGKPVGITPEMCASFVLQSAATVVQQNIPVLAFNELYLAEKWDEFAAVLLPNAPVQYRNQMLKIVQDSEDALDDADDDDDDEDDDDDDTDAPNDAAAPTTALAPAQAVKPKPADKPPTPARPPRQPRA